MLIEGIIMLLKHPGYDSAGRRFRLACSVQVPLQIVGTINAYTAILAENCGYKAIYLSGAGVANASYGLPDLAMTSLDNVLEDARRITSATRLPLLVDIDTGWGGTFNIMRTIQEMIKAEVAAVHIEDQVFHKRCGHRPQKQIVSCNEMIDRLKAAVDARYDPQFVIIARTDALAKEGLNAAIERAGEYIAAGADMIFAEAITELAQYAEFVKYITAPILANITEFGVTPLFSYEELKSAGVQLILYPLSAFRAMSAAALQVYKTIAISGTQKDLVPSMQTREELYKLLNYYAYENKVATSST